MKQQKGNSRFQLDKIAEYKNVDISTLIEEDLVTLATIYYGQNSNLKDCLISDAEVLFTSYSVTKKKCKLGKYIRQYEDAIKCFLNFNHAFFIKYTHEQKNKEVAFSLIGSSQVHLTKLQSQYNQLVYQKQRRQYMYSMCLAGFALLITTVFSVLAFLGINIRCFL